MRFDVTCRVCSKRCAGRREARSPSLSFAPVLCDAVRDSKPTQTLGPRLEVTGRALQATPIDLEPQPEQLRGVFEMPERRSAAGGAPDWCAARAPSALREEHGWSLGRSQDVAGPRIGAQQSSLAAMPSVPRAPVEKWGAAGAAVNPGRPGAGARQSTCTGGRGITSWPCAHGRGLRSVGAVARSMPSVPVGLGQAGPKPVLPAGRNRAHAS